MFLSAFGASYNIQTNLTHLNPIQVHTVVTQQITARQWITGFRGWALSFDKSRPASSSSSISPTMLLRMDKVEIMKHSLRKKRNACLLIIRLRTCCPLWWCKDLTQVAGHLPAKYSTCQQFSSYFVEVWMNFWMLKIKIWYHGALTINNCDSNH